MSLRRFFAPVVVLLVAACQPALEAVDDSSSDLVESAQGEVVVIPQEVANQITLETYQDGTVSWGFDATEASPDGLAAFDQDVEQRGRAVALAAYQERYKRLAMTTLKELIDRPNRLVVSPAAEPRHAPFDVQHTFWDLTCERTAAEVCQPWTDDRGDVHAMVRTGTINGKKLPLAETDGARVGFILRPVSTTETRERERDRRSGDGYADFVGKQVPLKNVFGNMETSTAMARGTSSSSIGPRDLARGDASSFVPLGSGLTLDFSGRSLYRNEGLSLGIKTGTVKSRPEVSVALKTHGGNIEKLRFEMRGTLDVAVTFELSTQTGIEKDVSVLLWEYYQTLPPQMIGPIPFVETVRVSVVASCHLGVKAKASLTAGLTAREEFNLGALYEAGAWTNLSRLEAPTVAGVEPELTLSGDAGLSCSVTPKFDLLFYNVAGPYLSVTPNAKLDIKTKTTVSDDGVAGDLEWTLGARLSAKFGFDSNLKVSVFPTLASILNDGLKKADITLYDQSWSLAKGDISARTD